MNISDERKPSAEDGAARPKVILIGLGNPIMGDDGIGWRVLEEIRTQLSDIDELPSTSGYNSVELDTQALGGLSLMERLEGYSACLLIDAVETGTHPVGHVFHFELGDLPENQAHHLTSTHDTNLFAAIEIGKTLGVQLPDKILIIGIEIRTSYDFSDVLSPAVEAAIPVAANLAIYLLKKLMS